MRSKNGRLVAALRLGDLFTRMAFLPQAHEFFSEVAELSEGIDKTAESVVMDVTFYHLHGKKDLWSDAFRSIARAETKLKRLLEPAMINSLDRCDGDLSEKVANLRITSGSPLQGSVARTPRQSRKSGKFLKVPTDGKASRYALSAVIRMEYESVTFAKMNVVVAENKGYSLARQKRFEEGHSLIDTIPASDLHGQEGLSAKITRAKILLLEVYQLLQSDPMLCVVSESGITCPGRSNSSNLDSKCSWSDGEE
jgi:hypothetical protein